MNIIPTTAVEAFAKGEMLQVLFFAVLFGLALLKLGDRAEALVRIFDQASHGLFGIVGASSCGSRRWAHLARWRSPIGRYGIGTLLSLGSLMAGVYTTCLLFVFVVLGNNRAVLRIQSPKFLRYIEEEILIVLGTSSSESVLPRMMAKLEHLGCSKPVVGLVIPTGYSFNLDGTSIYMTMAAIFVAQATGGPVLQPAAHDSGCAAADFERCRRRDRQRVHHVGRDLIRDSRLACCGSGATRSALTVSCRRREQSPI